MNFTRRSVLATLAGLLLAATVAQAQDPRASTVQSVARQWLALADTYDAQATWKAAGERFQQALSLERWADGLEKQRKPGGRVLQRTVAATTFSSSFSGLPEGGNYALVRFRTSFENRTVIEEDVTLEQEAGGAWKVIGYVIS